MERSNGLVIPAKFSCMAPGSRVQRKHLDAYITKIGNAKVGKTSNRGASKQWKQLVH